MTTINVNEEQHLSWHFTFQFNDFNSTLRTTFASIILDTLF